MINAKDIKKQFPIFSHHPNLAYLDNAATTQKPQMVIDGITNFYEKENANIHRGIYDLAAKTSQKYEAVRNKVAKFINALDDKNIVYTSGTTASINLVAYSFLAPRLKAGDEVMISSMEHHANLIPWQMVCKSKGAHLRIIPINENGELNMAAFKSMLSSKTKMVALVHVSNTLGTINPVNEVVEFAKQKNVPVLLDAAQSVAHYEIDIQKLEVDFLVFSGHKLFGPTGIGILYGKSEWLGQMHPYQFGGDMIKNVTFDNTTFAEAPQKFEAGTTNIAGVIGLGYAIDFISRFEKKGIQNYLKKLTAEATEKILAVNELKIIGTAKEKSAILSFVLGNVHPHDIATFLGAENIAVRAGNHCTQPLMDQFGLPGTTRASFTIYNTMEEVDRLVATLKDIQKFFS